MKQSGVGENRARETGDHNKAVEFIPGLKLSQHPPEQRKDLFLKKFSNIIKSKSLHPTEFEGYTIRERFEMMGWEPLLNFQRDKIYERVVIEWMTSLTKNGDELTGIVDGKSYPITPAIIRDILGVDTRIDLPYVRFSETPIVENGRRWVAACNTVFGLNENGKEGKLYKRRLMTPLVKIMWAVLFSSTSYLYEDRHDVWPREIYLLHALFTGDYLYSYAHMMIDNIWNMYEDENQHSIPHGSYISEILIRLGAVSEDECAEMVPSSYRVISRISLLSDLDFSESSIEYIIDDCFTEQRVTFPKKVIKKETPPQFSGPPSERVTFLKKVIIVEAPPQSPPQSSQPPFKHMPPQSPSQFSQPPFEHMPPQMPVPDQHVDMMKLLNELLKKINKQSSQLEKQYNELMAQATNIRKQMKQQVLEAECKGQEKEKRDEERERQAEIWSEEREKAAAEREKRAEEREKRAEEREKRAEERERWAEIRAHAIIWDIERQRYFYEKEQEQLRMAWNQFSGADEFQFPQISRTSFHPPQEGSQYYDPTHCNEIPEAFQSIYQNIYGLRR